MRSFSIATTELAVVRHMIALVGEIIILHYRFLERPLIDAFASVSPLPLRTQSGIITSEISFRFYSNSFSQSKPVLNCALTWRSPPSVADASPSARVVNHNLYNTQKASRMYGHHLAIRIPSADDGSFP